MTQPDQSELKCGHTAPDWNGEGDCITCARDRVLGASDIDRKLDELNKAFGGCTNCYGKGYATWRHGEFYKGQNHNLRNDVKFCDCDRGKAILALINEARADELKSLFNDPEKTFTTKGCGSGRCTSVTARIAQLKPDTTLEGGTRLNGASIDKDTLVEGEL